MLKFKVVAGKHHYYDNPASKNPQVITAMPGDIIESESNLEEIHGSSKFVRVSDSEAKSAESKKSAEESLFTSAELEKLTLEQLKATCKECQVDVPSNATKASLTELLLKVKA